MLRSDTRAVNALGALTVLLLSIGGLAIVKWIPYYDKAHLAFAPSFDRQFHPDGRRGSTACCLAALGVRLWARLRQVDLGGHGPGSSGRDPPCRRCCRGDGSRSVFGKSDSHHGRRRYSVPCPKMMCTCCAAPVVTGLRECRATPGAAIAFWLGNTVLNPATLIFTGFVLGWDWSIFRLAFGALMVFGLVDCTIIWRARRKALQFPRTHKPTLSRRRRGDSFSPGSWCSIECPSG